jgi:hypothetical protein
MAKNSAPQSVQVNLRGVQRPTSRAEGPEDISLDCDTGKGGLQG